jgi:hypothetical protein
VNAVADWQAMNFAEWARDVNNFVDPLSILGFVIADLQVKT